MIGESHTVDPLPKARRLVRRCGRAALSARRAAHATRPLVVPGHNRLDAGPRHPLLQCP